MIADSPDTARITARLIERLDRQLPASQRPLAEAFVRSYYRGASSDDLRTQDDGDLLGAAIAHFRLATTRLAGSHQLHIYNPQREQHGWHSSHTIIEIVTDDLPFLVDSVRMATARRGLTNHLIIHPILHVRRDAQGQLLEILDEHVDDGVTTEAVMHFEIDRMTEADHLEDMRNDIEQVLAQVRVVVDDWKAMQGRLEAVCTELEGTGIPVPDDERDKTVAFLSWLGDNHFTFLGYRCYELTGAPGDECLSRLPGSGLGILHTEDAQPSRGFAALPAEIRAQAREPNLLIVTKANQRATIHRPVYIDYVGIKRFDAEGQVCGEHRFLGLFSSTAYNRNTRDIPLLRDKVAYVMRCAGFAKGSHANRVLLNVLESYPRDELFQITAEQLLETALGIVHLQERQKVRLFLRRDQFNRFFSCLVFVPRERFNTEVRMRIVGILEEKLGGQLQDFSVQISESALARIHIIIRIDTQLTASPDVTAIELRLVTATRNWRDELRAALLDHHGEERGMRLFRHYQDAFRADYSERYPAQVAILDIDKMESLHDLHDLGMTLYRPLEATATELRFKLFRKQQPIPLSDVLPVLEHLGLRVLDESPSRIRPHGDDVVWIHDFGLELRDDVLDIEHIAGRFQEAFERVWFGAAESDRFNRLVLRAQLDWREVVVLRAYCKYLRQVQATFSQKYMESALDANPAITRDLVALFHVRLDPDRDGDRKAAEVALCTHIEQALDAVASLDEDRILRAFYSAIRATLRTNFYRIDNDGNPLAYLSFKIDSARVPGMPSPVPQFEIFVYSPRVEGIHLRGGKVARGGLRWSDRREDFRTEILGLVKAQMVKNAVIVPVGSKGGFVCKQLPADGTREELQSEVKGCYRTFIRGLLDLTDNLQAGRVVPPPRTVRHDDDDPYMVVAADKGTATFSDIANEIATAYGFWLDDAFASGGSAGYDHKAMGITARGGWESVKRHFRELGLDTQTQPFTVIGIGGMAGDVFGNGMLLSEQIRLVAAFNHRHIFIDPTPDPAVSFRERQRLFTLPGSSWDNYDPKLLSAGGGVWSRKAKSIRLPAKARAALGVEQESLTPNELIHALLRAPVDLLWNGGIGTYVKASDETHAEVGDRANDALRVDAPELRCRVIGEGGNLGMTQRGRIEFALCGGHLYTDAIDNSGGVDCSDHEVNIKILLRDAIDAGELTVTQRNRLLRQMTDEIAGLVLRNNYLQTQALSVAARQSVPMAGVHARVMRQLVDRGRLSRDIEHLPSDDELLERSGAGHGLTQPELAVLMAYVKIDLYQSLLDSTLLDDPALEATLVEYFPTPLRERFADPIRRHRLRREIAATQLANEIVNRAGLTFIFRLEEETGASVANIARAWIAACRAFDADALSAEIEALDNQVPAAQQVKMLLEQRKLVERATRWLLRNRPQPIVIGETVDRYAPGLKRLADALDTITVRSVRKHPLRAKLRKAGVPEALAAHVAGLGALVVGLDIIEAALVDNLPVEMAGKAYFRLGERLGLNWLRERIDGLPRHDRWQSLARAAMRDDLSTQQRLLTCSVLAKRYVPSRSNRSIEAWIAANADLLERFQRVLDELRAGKQPDFAMLSVAMRELRTLRPPMGD